MTPAVRLAALTAATVALFLAASWLAVDGTPSLADEPPLVQLVVVSIARLAWIPTAMLALRAWMSRRLTQAVDAPPEVPIHLPLDGPVGLANDPVRARRVEALVAASDSLAMYLQPIVDLRSGRVAGYEALARFVTLPPQPPDWWFTEAHRLGRGVDLENEAIRRALTYLGDLPDHVYLSLNLSPAALHSDTLRHLLRDHDPARIVLELTEHDIVEDYDELRRTIGSLVAAGTRLAVDDAGAGFASLRHILNLAPAIVKLDRSLVAGIDKDRYRRALAASLLRFAAEASVDVVAEGVERDHELDTLIGLGVPYAQGYLLGRPAPVADTVHDPIRHPPSSLAVPPLAQVAGLDLVGPAPLRTAGRGRRRQ